MTTELMRDLLTNDEKITIEYKTCQRGIQEDVYETVCSFSNRYGGYIIMGVEDDGTPIGINRNMSKDMRKNFVNQLNNPDRMSPTLYLSIEEFEYEGKLLLWVYVPPTSTVEKCINRIYDRNEDGDMDITDSPIQLQNMYNRKSNTYAEHRIFPYVTKDDLRIDLMDKVRNLVLYIHSFIKNIWVVIEHLFYLFFIRISFCNDISICNFYFDVITITEHIIYQVNKKL